MKLNKSRAVHEIKQTNLINILANNFNHPILIFIRWIMLLWQFWLST